MITPKDIEHLKTIFATKEELQDVKSELKAEIIALRTEMRMTTGALKDDIQNIKHDIKTLRDDITSIKQMMQDMLSCFNDIIVEQDKQSKKIDIHHSILKNHAETIHHSFS